MHFEIPFIFVWSCHPKNRFAGIIKKARVNSFDAFKIIAVIYGIGGSSLKASSTPLRLIFSSSTQRISCYLESANSSGVWDAIKEDIFSTREIKSLKGCSSLRSLWSFLSCSIITNLQLTNLLRYEIIILWYNREILREF